MMLCRSDLFLRGKHYRKIVSPDRGIVSCALPFNDCLLNDLRNVVNYPDRCVRNSFIIILHHRDQVVTFDVLNLHIANIRNHIVV